MSNNSKLVLQQVRESYRFLFEYQAKVLNLLKYIEKKFALKYLGGFSKFSKGTPKNGKGNLDLWAWDWLNLYLYEFHFGFYTRDFRQIPFQETSIDNDYFGLSIFLLSDDGYFLSNLNEEKNTEKIFTDSFLPTDQSDTKLIFVASKNIWDITWWNSNKNQGVVHKDFLTKSYGIKDNGNNTKMVFKAFDMSLFFDEYSALQSLKEFELLCNQNDIVFKLSKDNIFNK